MGMPVPSSARSAVLLLMLLLVWTDLPMLPAKSKTQKRCPHNHNAPEARNNTYDTRTCLSLEVAELQIHLRLSHGEQVQTLRMLKSLERCNETIL